MKDSRKKGSRKRAAEKRERRAAGSKGTERKGTERKPIRGKQTAQGSLGGVRPETGDSAETEIRTENAPGCRAELLPEDFREKMRKLLGKEYEAYLESFEKPCHNGLRVNTMKLSAEDWNRLSPFQTEPVHGLKTVFTTTLQMKAQAGVQTSLLLRRTLLSAGAKRHDSRQSASS